MNFPSKILEQAVGAIATLPGIGKKTALRLALHLVQDNSEKTERLVESLKLLKEKSKFCKHCNSISDADICEICANSSRDNGILCIVESIRDVMAIEDTDQFKGKYHVLGGVISPIDGIGPGDINIENLIHRVNQDETKELIMALSPTIEGDTTVFYISKLLQHTEIKISAIARGVSFGGDLEYADEFTLGRSISGRLPYKMSS